MYYTDLKSILSSFASVGWPGAGTVADNTTYDIVGFGSGNGPVPVTVGDLESALAAELPGAPISALLSAVPDELTSVVNQFTTRIQISGLRVETGVEQDSKETIRSFSISLEPSDDTATLAGLTIKDYGLQLNFVPLNGALIWNPILFATAEFRGVTCGLQVGLRQPSIVLALSEGDGSIVNTILGSGSSDNSIASLANSMDLTLAEDEVELDLFLVKADLSDAPQFDCAIALSFGASTVKWGDFTLNSLAFEFTHGGGDNTVDAKVVAAIGGYEVDGEVTYDSAAETTTFTGTCPAIGVTLEAFWETLSGDLGVDSPIPGLDDVYISGMGLTLTRAQGKTSFEIHCGGSVVFDALGAPLWFKFTFDKQADGEIDTTLTLNDLEFDLAKTDKSLLFSFKGPAQLPLAELVAAAQISALTSVANKLDLTIEDADLVFVKDESTKKNHILFAAKLTFDATVSAPILTMITGVDSIGCTGATLFATNGAWTLDEINAVGGRAVDIAKPVPEGVSAIPVLSIGSVQAELPLSSPSTNNTAGTDTAQPQPYGGVASTGGTWFKIKKQLGPVYVDRLGLGLSTGESGPDISLMADASFAIGPLTIALNGFDIDLPYRQLSDVSVSLHGLDVTYDKPPLTIGGGFLSAGDDTYIGDLTIKTETFLLGAIGEYAQKSGHTSLAIFAAMTQPPLGGPVYCYVEGLAAGGGYNSALQIPTKVSDVANFALVQVASDGLPANDPFSVIEACVSPSVGEDWIALGLVFRSFEVVHSTALLTAAFGDHLQFAILGQSEMSLPPASTDRIAYAQIDVEAQYVPSQNAISVAGILTPKSYVLSQDCHIQGGFIYILKSSGAFIISYGGYAPGFDYQSLGYPAVPRLSLSWRIDSHTSIKGDEYCALTPAAMMAGGGLQANWDCGIFAAWFDVSVDFLIQWRPFHYEADFSMSLGVSFDLKIAFIHIHFTFHIGASLKVHGPPFGGQAHIDLDVISFDVSFGAGESGADVLPWTGFRAMLPGDPSTDETDSPLLSAKVTDGLVKDCSKTAGKKQTAALLTSARDDDTPDWIVNGTHFCFVIQSSLPVTKASSDATSVTETPLAPPLGILPMGLGATDGTLDVTIMGPEGLVSASSAPDAVVTVEAITTKGAPALWGQAQPSNSNEPAVDVTTGYLIKGGIKPSDQTLTVSVADLLDEEITVQAVSDRAASATPFG